LNQATVERLNRLNRDFYESHGDDFSGTREGHWPGWQTVLDYLRGDPRWILDAGCGNGRFGRFLESRLAEPFDYVGIDASERLLEHARSRLTPGRGRRELVLVDLLDSAPSTVLPPDRFDLIAVFGLTHHLPGLHRRRALLADLAALLAPGGDLVVAFWQFAEEERFRRRMVDWEVFNSTASEPVDLGQLEPGDHLLTWGQRSAAVRYCHHSDDLEIEQLVRELGLDEVARFRSPAPIDRLNLYVQLRNTSREGARASPTL
jgi:SAM-dependent methyltransferase